MGRNEKNAEAIISLLTTKHPGLSINFIPCDMTSLASVQKAAQDFIAENSRLDVFICNAGIMCSEAAVTADGYQSEFQTNHLSHALLIKKLLPLMQSTAAADDSDVRIINIASTAYVNTPAGGIDFDTLRTSQEKLSSRLGARWARYGQTKLANIMYADALAKRYPELVIVSVHPGYIFTDLWKNLPIAQRLAFTLALWSKSVKSHEGAYSQLWASTTSKGNLKSGAYYEPVGKTPRRSTELARDEEGHLADKLWEWTQDALKDF